MMLWHNDNGVKLMASEKFDFKGSLGETLAARIDKPNGDIKSYALFAHCFTGSKDILASKYIAQTLNWHGIAVVRFDFTGLGESDGDFANTNFTSNIEDLVKAADYMRGNFEAPSLLVGHSLGGAAVIAAAHQIPEADAVATIGAPSDSKHVGHLFEAHHDEILKEGEAEVCLANRPFKIKKQFLNDINNQNMNDHIAHLNKALMVMHAPLDKTVGIENASQIFIKAKHPKSYISLDDSDHLMTNKEDCVYAAHVIARWSERYIYR